MAENYEATRLAERIKSYATSYYEGEPEISDESFDLLVEQLRRMEPDNPVLDEVGWGYTIETDLDDSKPHKFEVRKFEDKIREISRLHIKQGEGVITPKLDGGSVCCYYVDGKLDYALTRGDGVNGFDITPKMKFIIPPILKDSTFTGMVRGEITMADSVFDEKYADRYDSNRNLSVGLIRRRFITREELKDISFVAYTVRGISDMDIDSKSRVFNWLRFNGFDTVDIIPSPNTWTDESFRQLILDYRELHRYPIDGIVVTSEKYQEMDDGTFVPICEMAYKTAADSAVSKITRIDWNLTRTGRMVPVINIEPVFLSGASISRATAYNAQWVKTTGMGVGSEIRIQRSGEVIPSIVEVLTEGDPCLPEYCPSCHQKLIWSGTDLKCDNPDCEFKESSRLWTWVNNTANPKGLGVGAKKTLFEKMDIFSIDDLYAKVDDIVDESSKWAGMVTHERYKEMVRRLKKEMPANIFFQACSIPGCGPGGAKALGHHLDTILYAPLNEETFEKIRNIGGAQYGSKNWVVNNINAIRRWATYPERIIPMQEIEDNNSAPKLDKLIAVTGKLSTTRSKFFEEMAHYGYGQGSMANASYLVTNNPNSTSSKMRQARERGVIVISENDFREMIGAPIPE